MTTSRTGTGTGPAIASGIAVLTVATAAIHLWLGFGFGNTLFILNGVGYLGLLAAFLFLPAGLDRFRGLVRWVLAAYAALTIALYFVMAPMFAPIGLADKAIEVGLIALLIADAARSRSQSGGASAEAGPARADGAVEA